MTGLGERHITDCYTTGRNDGAPESHPGQTPFNGTETWSPGHNGGDARVFLKYCYPAWTVENGVQNTTWPRQESYFNQRYFWTVSSRPVRPCAARWPSSAISTPSGRYE